MDLNKLGPETKLVPAEIDLTQTRLAEKIDAEQKISWIFFWRSKVEREALQNQKEDVKGLSFG